MRKVFITVLATLLATMLLSATFAQTSQVSYYNGDSVPLFQGTLAYQEGFSHDSLANSIISSDEAYYSAQYYGERADSPESIKLAVLDGYVVWQFDFVDQVICIDAQDATNAYALPVDGIAYTYIMHDFSNSNVVSSYSSEVVSYDTSAVTSQVVTSPVVANPVAMSQENYNISSGGYDALYGGYATYEEYLAAYTASVNQIQAAAVAAAPVAASSYASEVVYMGSANSLPVTSSVSIQQEMPSAVVVGPVENLGILANTVGSNFDDEGYDGEGYNRQGYDREGYNRAGYNMSSFDREGYNQAGYNMSGYDREGYNQAGFNSAGYNREGARQ